MLHALRGKLRRAAREQYEAEYTAWLLIATHSTKPPTAPSIPDLLRDD